eukprot:scaffold62974_cov65-Phaeocystis_antarctica.AAC.3
MDGSHTAYFFIYIVAAPSAAHPSCWPYRLHGAPAPSALPTHPHPTLVPALIYASAERAKPNVLHVGVERIGKGAAVSNARVYR